MPLVDAATLRQFCCQLSAATAFRFACCPMQLALCSHDGGSAHTADSLGASVSCTGEVVAGAAAGAGDDAGLCGDDAGAAAAAPRGAGPQRPLRKEGPRPARRHQHPHPGQRHKQAIRSLFVACVVCRVLTLTLSLSLTLTLTCMLIDNVLQRCLVDCRAARLTSRRQPWFPSPDASSCSSWAGSCSCRHAKLPPLHTAQCRLVATICRMVSEYLLMMCPGSDAACWPCPGAR